MTDNWPIPHFMHCNLGEYQGSCKYGEDDICPALQKLCPTPNGYEHDVHCNADRRQAKWVAGSGCSCYLPAPSTDPDVKEAEKLAGTVMQGTKAVNHLYSAIKRGRELANAERDVEIIQLKNTIRFLEMDKEVYEMIIAQMQIHNGLVKFEMNSQKMFDEIIKKELDTLSRS